MQIYFISFLETKIETTKKQRKTIKLKPISIIFPHKEDNNPMSFHQLIYQFDFVTNYFEEGVLSLKMPRHGAPDNKEQIELATNGS